MLIKNTVPVSYSDEKKALKISELESKLKTKKNCENFIIKDIEHRQGKDKSLYIRIYHEDCGREFHTTSSKFFKNDTLVCPECNNVIMHKEVPESLIDFISEILTGKNIAFNKKIDEYTFDIYIEELNIAIIYYEEIPFNFITKVRIIQISKNEWYEKNELSKLKLKEIFNIERRKILHASLCKIKEINIDDKNKFLEETSLFGIDDSNLAIGLFSVNGDYTHSLVSVMTFKILGDGIFELKSFSTLNERFIPGAFGTLITYFRNNYNYTKIIHEPNLCWLDIRRNIFLANKFEIEDNKFIIRNK